MANDMARATNNKPKFFNLTQGHGCPSASAQAQTSAVRSHLAIQQHARRRERQKVTNENTRNEPREEFDNGTQSSGLIDVRRAAPTDLVYQAEIVTETPPHLGFASTLQQPHASGECQTSLSPDSTLAGISCVLVSLPFDLTTDETRSLHFYLTSGRQKLLGAPMDVEHCPLADLAKLLIHVCPIYVLAHIVLGELLLSEYTGRSVRPHYYARSAQMYMAVSATLADKEATFCHKLWAIIQVAMVERMARRYDLQMIHNRALDDFFESQGGVATSYHAQVDDVYLRISSRLYAGPLIRSAVVSPGIRQFDAVKGRFISALHEIQDRLDVFCSEFTRRNANTEGRTPQLDRLKQYLDLCSQSHHRTLTGEKSCEYELGIFFCLLSMTRTFIDCPCTQESVIGFLSRVQDYLDGNSPSNTHDGYSIHPAATAYGISCIRSEIFPQNHWQTEFKISQLLADGQSIFFLADSTIRKAIVTWLATFISTTAHLSSHGVEFEDESEIVQNFEIQTLSNELESSWREKSPQK